MTDDLRLTVVSDETAEFSNNKNNSFKVRLPRPLTLPNGPWATSLWTLSVPDDAVEQKLGKGTDFFCTFGGHLAQMWNVKNGKYSSITARSWSYHIMYVQDVFTSRPKSGVDLWKRVHQLILETQTTKLQEKMNFHPSIQNWRVQQPQAWFPTFRWEGEDLIKEADRSVTYSPTDIKTQFTMPLKVCESLGLFKFNVATQKWEVGPNLIPSYPVYQYDKDDDVSTTIANAYQRSHPKSPHDLRSRQKGPSSGLVSHV